MRLTTAFLAFALTAAVAPGARAQETDLASLRASAASRDPQALLQLGRALRRAGRFDEAVTVLRGAARGATRLDALWETARVRVDQNDFRATRAACNALPAGRNARDPAGLLRRVCMARAHLVWQRAALAEREITAAQQIDPNHGELQLAIGDMNRLSGQVAAAETAYRAAAQALPSRADPHIGLALLLETAQRFDDAEAAYRRAIAADAADPAANLALGRFLIRRRRDHAAALPLLRRAVESRPNWPEALVALGDAHLAAGATADALAVFQQAAQLAPTQPGAQSGLGRARLRAGQLAEAEPALRLAIQQVPNDAEAHAALAEVLGRTDRGEPALEAWNRAIDLLPGDPTPRLRAAEQARTLGQNSLARAYLDRILSEDARYAPALVMRADIAFMENNRAEARQLYQAALNGRGEIDRARVQARIAEIDAPDRRQRRR